jgi:hypothetical protein
LESLKQAEPTMSHGSTTLIRRNGETYFGVDITPDGHFVVAERGTDRPLRVAEFPAGDTGTQAVRRHIERKGPHPHVCIKACGGAALALATSLIPVQGIEVALIAPAALRGPAAPAGPDEPAERLVRLAERMF